jgi:L-aminoadipate-semialdehyde dehydrogenase
VGGEPVYPQSLDKLLCSLDPKSQTADPAALSPTSKATILVTGATGFIRWYIANDSLRLEGVRALVHIWGTKSIQVIVERLQRPLRDTAYGRILGPPRLSVFIDNLSQPRLGFHNKTWDEVCDAADAVIHNGAAVHWVKHYKDLAGSNVLLTLDALRLCSRGKPKLFLSIGSIRVLVTDHYIKLLHEQTSTGQGAGMEADDMMGSRFGLGTGHG